MLHCGIWGLVVGRLCVFLDSPSSQMCSDSSYWTMGTAALTPSLGPHCRTVTQRICIAEGEEISSEKMNHPSVCGNSCVVSKKLRKTAVLLCTEKEYLNYVKFVTRRSLFPSPPLSWKTQGMGGRQHFDIRIYYQGRWKNLARRFVSTTK